MELPRDFIDLLADFARHEVRYLLIGGYAVGYHAEPRATKDIDLLVAADELNQTRLCAALTEFGAPAHVVQAARCQRDDEIVYLGNPPLRIDILRAIPGVVFEEAYAARIEERWNDTPVIVIGRQQLIEAKEAAGRPQDLADVAALRG